MSHSIFDEVKVFEDTDENTDVIKSFIKTEHESTEEPFCVLDVADVMQKHQNWIAKMPRIVPHYGNIRVLDLESISLKCSISVIIVHLIIQKYSKRYVFFLENVILMLLSYHSSDIICITQA